MPLLMGEGASCLPLGKLLAFSGFQVKFTVQFLGVGAGHGGDKIELSDVNTVRHEV